LFRETGLTTTGAIIDGFLDQDEGRRVERPPNPFGPEKVLTMSPE
jgi:hypothetical protein